jgi:hypothetical protein
MPEDKMVGERLQTRHKLELMERYWGAWCTILAQTKGKYTFCPTRLWLIDTHGGTGAHKSATDPDGKIEGTPALPLARSLDSLKPRATGVLAPNRDAEMDDWRPSATL